VVPFEPEEGFWVQIPAGRARLGVSADEARTIAKEHAATAAARGPTPGTTGRSLLEALTFDDTSASAAFVEGVLRDEAPLREIDLPVFAIARRTITNGEVACFMKETNTLERHDSWDRPGAVHLPAEGISFRLARAIAAWAGARLPFEDEWEHAVRSADARVEGALAGRPEWCADLWTRAGHPPWWRVLRGVYDDDAWPASALGRTGGNPFGFLSRPTLRIVRAGHGPANGAKDRDRNADRNGDVRWRHLVQRTGRPMLGA
jgi:hypothetical protein